VEFDLVVAGADDADAMRALVVAAFERYTEPIGRPPAPMTADWDAVARSGTAVLARERGTGALLGLVVVIDDPESDAILVEDVAVAPAAQGTGLGSALLALADRTAREHGRSVVRLFTNEAMTENLAYYPRRGFVETGRREQDGFRRVFFEKRV
jgi:GNAT superfamily N-acetyltransferase